MTDINFTSTFRIPITQAGVNNSKKLQLRALVGSYRNSLIGNGKQGYARVSIMDSEDEKFLRKLKKIGYKTYQRFDGENIAPENIDMFIKQKLDVRDYNQKGKNPAAMPNELKEQRRYERRFTPQVKKETPETEAPVPTKAPETKPLNIEELKAKPTRKELRAILKENAENAKIRKSSEYIKMKEKYGEEFAEAVYFSTRKKG